MESDFRLAAGIKMGDTVKTFALAATLALIVCGSAQAALIEVAGNVVDVAAAPAGGTVLLQPAASDLAEPEMFAMMALGLLLIGYRATRDSGEKFQ